MTQRIKTIPDLSLTSPQHMQAIAAGTEHFRLWERNVIDEFKDLSEEEIKQKLQQTAFPFAVCVENLIGDFNFATVIRNANAFNAQHFFYLGDKKFDRRGAQGCYHYMNITWLPTVDDFLELKKKYVVVGCDNIAGAIPLCDYSWAPNTLMVFGSEGVGLTPTIQSMCQDLVYIEQFGSIRSLNVGTASGIMMNDFVSKYRAARVGA
jgi:tRNA G18 (ribose-2'-O)-methylase SpoU